MNIFVLHRDPVIAAQMQCDKHVVKMVLESAQLLCSVWHNAPYKRTHYNHPCSKWVRASKANYAWMVQHALALSKEYTYRYGKVHKSKDAIDWCNWGIKKDLYLPDVGLTPFAQAMPDIYKSNDPVEAYRNYYKGEKASIAKWNKTRAAPDWWNI